MMTMIDAPKIIWLDLESLDWTTEPDSHAVKYIPATRASEAADELLAALVDLVDWFDCDDDATLLLSARRAIAKAKGTQGA